MLEWNKAKVRNLTGFEIWLMIADGGDARGISRMPNAW
jgi:hypothetical protein